MPPVRIQSFVNQLWILIHSIPDFLYIHLELKWQNYLFDILLWGICCVLINFEFVIPCFHPFYLILVMKVENLARVEDLFIE